MSEELPCRRMPERIADTLFFAAPGTDECRQAKALCFQHCPMLHQCAEMALTEGIPHGVFGGLDERDRRTVWKRQGGKPKAFEARITAYLERAS